MGGRGASSGLSDTGKQYGSEYRTLAQFGNIKVVKIREGSVTAPMETMTSGRIYATVDKNNDIKHITFYDTENERYKQIDVKGHKHQGLEQHVHLGYEHDEYGSRDLNAKERALVDYILKEWDKKRKRLGL